ncbi:MAG: SDR family NAD-dependent epimerase/dehydratase, partial [Longimicrobiales bacterium]
LTVYGDGGQTRSFCYVEDEVEGLYRLFLSDYTMPVNIGNPIEFTILELAEKVLALVGGPSHIDYRPLPEDDPKVRQPDITVARELLHWEPAVTLDEGLRRTIPYFAEVIAASEHAR